jgi:PAS domain S-box-containing protein
VIHDLRTINRELDERVGDRTRELTDTLERERIEDGKTRAILESIADSVLVFDLQGRLISANPVFNRLIHAEGQDLTGKTFLEMLGGSTISGTEAEAVREVFRSPEQSNPVRIRIRGHIYSLILSPVLVNEGNVLGTVAVLHDITHEVEISDMKSTFVSMVSHELRTPLSAAMGLFDLFQMTNKGKFDASQNQLIERVVANNQKLLNLVNDLLDMTKIEAGTLSVKMVPFSPADFVKKFSETMESTVSARGLKWITSIAPDVPEIVTSDPDRLHQIMVNLIDNALKFTERGEIEVRCHLGDREHLCLDVRDTGQGIPGEALERIFEPFWQVDSSISRHVSGAGLGLSIVYRLVKLLQGEISVKSIVDQGSTFTVTLPLAARALEEPTQK